MKRRTFLSDTGKGLALGMAAPFILSSCKGSNDRVNIGFLGMGGRAHSLLKSFMLLKDVQVVGIYDPFKERSEDRVNWINGVVKKRNEQKETKINYDQCTVYEHYSDLLANKNIDAVVIASPDHWHVPLSYAAIEAGKDVYVEKPLGLTIEQGQILRELAANKNTILQYGTQQRSSKNFWLAAELTRREEIGKLERIDAWCPGQNSDYITSKEPMVVPDNFDYDVWLGPAKKAPYTKDRCTSEGAWHISDYAIGFIAGWGAHPLDIAQWGNNSDDSGPIKFMGKGGFFPKESLFDTLNSWDIQCEYANGVKMHFFSEDYMPEFATGYKEKFSTHGTTFWGSDGWVSVDRSGIEASDPKLLDFTVAPGEEVCYRSENHWANFISCIKSRKQTISPVGTAVRSDTISHLGNILISSDASELQWDPAKEEIINPSPGMKAMLHRPQRNPYDII